MALHIDEIGVRMQVGSPPTGEAAADPGSEPAAKAALPPTSIQQIAKQCVARVMAALRRGETR